MTSETVLPPDDLFRPEALRYHRAPLGEGRLLRLAPEWTRAAYWVLSVALLLFVLFSIFATVHEYASGPAVVRLDQRTQLTARSDGTVASVEVRPGQRVAAGQVLARFYLVRETAELERIQHEFDLQLVKVLRDGSDEAARQALTRLRAERELAEVKLGERSVRAPVSGVVSDIRVRPGQHLEVGDLVLSLIGDDAHFSLVAMLPGQYRPLLRLGQPMRFELGGFKYEYRDLVIDTIGDEVVGPREVQRYLGSEVADSIAVHGPVVLVEAHLPVTSFWSEGHRYEYFEGLTGTAEAKVRAEPIVFLLVPALKRLFGSHGR